MTPCIEWNKYRYPSGYGQRWFRGKKWRAHRAAWVEVYGDIPNGIQVCHKCDNPACIKVEHLFLGTNRDNVVDRDRKGRGVKPCGRKDILSNDLLNRIRAMAKYSSYREIKNYFGVGLATINRIVKKGVNVG